MGQGARARLLLEAGARAMWRSSAMGESARAVRPVRAAKDDASIVRSDFDRLPRQELPMTLLFQPDHQDADLHRIDLAVALALTCEDKS